MNLSSSLKVSNSDESKFLTKSFILIWPSALFFFFLFHFSLFLGFFSLSLTLSLTVHQIRLAIHNIPTPNPFATSQHWTHSQRSLLPNPFATIPIRDDLVESFAVLIAFACSSSLLLVVVAFTRRRHICLLSSHLLAVVAFARRRRSCLLVVADQTPATFRLPPTPTL